MGPGAKPLLAGLRSETPEVDDIFVKISCFVTVLRMAWRYLHSLPTIEYEIEEK